jgi:uncharacterized protein YndB with AHSA1/START domain
MSVKKDESGRRWIEVDVEVPGTPEEVWQAIATGPGVSSWFVPMEVEEREGRPVTVTHHFGPGMDSRATVTAWEPPHRFGAESLGLGPNAPPLATEWVVEARSGGVCVVRVIHSLFASTDEWDDQLDSIESGWPAFFRILRLYLAHFRGQRCTTLHLIGVAPAPEGEAWHALTAALGLTGQAAGVPWRSAAGVPPLAGRIAWVGEGRHRHELVLLDEPAPGIAFFIANAMGGQVYLTISFYLYGDRAGAAVARDEPAWHEWMQERFHQV